MKKRGYYLKSFLMLIVIIGLTFFIKIPNAKAAGAHKFSFTMYNCYSVDENALTDQIDDRGRVTTAAQIVCNGPNNDGNLPEINSGDTVRPGQIIKLGVHYIPDLDYMDIGMQVKFFYDNTAFETIKLSKYDRRSSSYNDVVAQDLGPDLVDFYKYWQITTNDTGSGINYMANDSRASAGDPIMDELDMVYYYFKVKDTATPGAIVDFTFDETYGNGTAFNNKSDYTVTNSNLEIFGEAEEDLSLATLNVKNGSTNYTLTPTFTPGSTDVTSYSTVVPNNISSVDIEATPTDSEAVLTGDGTKSLSIGNNSFDITVLSTSGETQIYTVNVYRLNNDATLSSLGLTDVDFGTFNKNTESYTATVPNSTTSTTVSATPTDTKATVTGTGSVNLSEGENTVSVEVTPENCKSEYESVPGNTCTKKTYTVTVTREAAAQDATLEDLTVDGTTVPGFDPDVTEYTLDTVGSEKTSITIGYVATDSNATVTGAGVQNLEVGDNRFEVTVETDLGSKVYAINIHKKNNDATLSSLELPGINIGTFSKDKTSYGVSVKNDITSVTVNATPTDSNATVTGTGSHELVVGRNTINIEVTAEDGTTKTYKVTVTRLEPAVGAHHFSFEMYNCYSLDEDTLTDQIDGSGRVTTAAHIDCKGPAGDGNTPLIESGAAVQPGQIIKFGVHYNPDLDYTDIGMQVKFFYDNTAFETIKLSKYDRRTSTYSNVVAQDLGEDLVTYYDHWQITTNDTGSGINFMANDSRASAGDPIMDELNMVYYYFKVKDTATLNVDIPFTYDETYGNGTAFNNKSSYTVTNTSLKVLDELDEDNTLGTLSVKHDSTNYALTPEFVPGNKEVVSYSTVVPNNIENVDVSATPFKETSTLTGTGTKNVSVGDNDYNLTVLAQSGDTQIYTVNVHRLNNDATLSSLGLTDVDFGTFDKDTDTYTATVPYTTESTTVSATPTDTNATASGTGEQALEVGENTIEVEVSPESCKSEYESVPGNTCTKKTYTVTVTREAASVDASLDDLKVDGETVEGFDKDTLSYTLDNVANDKTSISIEATTSEEHATIAGTGSKELQVGDNSFDVVVTAQDGTTKKTYTINVRRKSDDNTLKSLSVTSDPEGTLSPAFNKDTKEYTYVTDPDETEVVINAEATEEHATVEGNGTYDPSTTNKVEIKVTSENGTVNTYTVNLERAESKNADLKSLGVTDETISPAFDKDTLSYTVTVPSDKTKATITAEVADDRASLTGTGEKNLDYGENTFDVVVTAEDGTTKKTYTVNITREKKTDAKLSDLKVDGTTVPGFDPETYEYTLDDVENDKASVNITYVTSDTDATVTGDGNQNLSVGDNSLKVTVTAQDGTTTKEYTINIRRKSDDSSLKSLTATSDPAGTLSPAFDPATTTYTYSVDADEDSVTISAEPTDSNATVSGTGTYNPRTDGPVEIIVTSENGTTKTYTVNFDVAKSSNADLSNLGVTGQTISPAFDKDTTTYNVTVPSDKTKATITAEVADDRSTVTGTGEQDLNYGENTFDVKVTAEDGTEKTYTVNITREKKTDAGLDDLQADDVTVPGFAVDKYEYDLGNVSSDKTTIKLSATSSDTDATIEGTGTKNLVVGENSFDVVVTAQDGTTKKTYTIKVKRLNSSKNLESLTVTSDPQGTLSPVFDPETNEYTYEADPDETEVTISATVPEGSNATIEGQGTYNPRETDKVEIVVKAEDGTEKTYTVNLELAKSKNADLKSLGVTDETISPAFDKDTLTYNVTVPSDKDKATITAEVADDRASLTGTGEKTLNYGDNSFDVVVTAEDGTTIKTYTVNITREKKTDSSLTDIKVDGVSIPGFDPDVTEYTIDPVNSDKENIVIEATVSDPDATVTGTGTKTVQTGDNSFDVVVTAQDGTTTKTYTINVKKLSSDSSLNGITVTSDPQGTFEPTFDPAVTEYTYTAGPDVDSVTISATPNQDGAIVSGEGTYNPKDTDTVELIVTAEDGTTTTYVVHLENEKSSNADLSDLGVTGETLNPAFDKDTTNYTVTVPNDTDKATITAEAADSRSTVTGTGEKDLNYGSNNFDVVVTAEDGTKKTYTVTIERELSNDVKLSDLTVDGTTVDGFDPDTSTYTIPNVGNDVTSITVGATPENPEATVTGTGEIPLEVGNNTIEVTVTAQDGSKGTYTINVTREADSNNDLKSLEVEGQTISPEFDPDTTSYTVTVPSDVDKVTVNAEPDSDKATVTGTGEHDLQPGENTIEVTVKAEDGTEKTYTITVTKEEDDEKITSIEYGHIIEDHMIKSVIYKSIPEELRNQLDNENWKLHIFDKDDTAEIDEEAKLGTGMIIKLIINDTVKDDDYLVVKGDVDGNSRVALLDAVMVLNHYLENNELTGIWFEAGDMDSNGQVKLLDAVNILKVYLED